MNLVIFLHAVTKRLNYEEKVTFPDILPLQFMNNLSTHSCTKTA